MTLSALKVAFRTRSGPVVGVMTSFREAVIVFKSRNTRRSTVEVVHVGPGVEIRIVPASSHQRQFPGDRQTSCQIYRSRRPVSKNCFERQTDRRSIVMDILRQHLRIVRAVLLKRFIEIKRRLGNSCWRQRCSRESTNFQSRSPTQTRPRF